MPTVTGPQTLNEYEADQPGRGRPERSPNAQPHRSLGDRVRQDTGDTQPAEP
jgi:hypothetical protein